MSANQTGNNRSSIFETFNSPYFGDDEPSLAESSQHTALGYLSSRVEPADNADEAHNDVDDVHCEPGDEEATTTLWMSCSPGRDSTDQDEEEEDEGEDEDEDDCIPLACFQTSKTINKQSAPVVKHKKVVKTGKKQKKKEKGPNTPKKPMSAYSIFFRDTQSSIKAQNPQATFGDISRIVASMWDSLDVHEKDKYNIQAEKAKQAYLKTVEEHKVGKKLKAHKSATPRTKSNSKLTKNASDNESESVKSSCSESSQENVKQVRGVNDSKSSKSKMVLSDSESGKDSSSEKSPVSPSKEVIRDDSEDDRSSSCIKSKPLNDFKQSIPRCTRAHCTNIAVEDARWDFDFCSVDCVVSHCKDIFAAWVASLRSVRAE